MIGFLLLNFKLLFSEPNQVLIVSFNFRLRLLAIVDDIRISLFLFKSKLGNLPSCKYSLKKEKVRHSIYCTLSLLVLSAQCVVVVGGGGGPLQRSL